jgi:hypothetical protein
VPVFLGHSLGYGRGCKRGRGYAQSPAVSAKWVVELLGSLALVAS